MKSNQAEFGTSQQHQGMLCFDKEQRRETPLYTYMYIYMYSVYLFHLELFYADD